MFQLQTKVVEGLTNNDVPTTFGEAGNAVSYADNIKSLFVKMQDQLLITKYRKDYETIIINLDEYTGMLMIKQILNLKLDGDDKTILESLNNINILKNVKDSLNGAMKFLDSQ